MNIHRMKKYKQLADKHVDSFLERIEKILQWIIMIWVSYSRLLV